MRLKNLHCCWNSVGDVSLLVGIATASFITFNISHIGLPNGLSACSNCLSPKVVPPSDRLAALNLIQSFVEPLNIIAVREIKFIILVYYYIFLRF